RPLASNTRAMASSREASAARPYTVSVGRPTRPPLRSTSTASATSVVIRGAPSRDVGDGSPFDMVPIVPVRPDALRGLTHLDHGYGPHHGPRRHPRRTL